ncbi:sodium-dependent transporter, partial [Aminivibrio sp.]|uniref:sodium-dependent transporter n=1 Tax=Aminivibrio sp. TaxID=1872489 RepID=UPI001A36DB1E
LSLGMGCMITYGSYVDKQTALPGAAIQVCVIDTLVAILAGLAIFPAVFAFGVDAGAGPGLTFVTLPSVFAKMAGGSIWSALFFLLLFIAALTSAISLLEVVASYVIDKGWGRPKAAVIMGLLIFALGVPSAMSLAGAPKIAGKDFLDAMDFISNNVLLPLGGAFIALFVGWIWTADARKEVTNEGTVSFGLMELWIWVCRIVAPLGILYIFITGLKW